MKLNFAGTTDKGCIRSVNQDSYYIDPEGRFFIVADGMGGHAGGQEASRIAAEVIKNYLVSHWQDVIESSKLLEDAFLKANEAILYDQLENPERSDMGTTAVVVIFREQEHWCANVGDSRFYRLRDQNLEQITEDQTWVAQAVRQNALTPEQARVHPWRHLLSQCLGRKDMGKVDTLSIDIQTGDRLLLCSDGLTEDLSDTVITPMLSSSDDCETIAKELVDAAKDAGGRDNITAVIVIVGNEK
ncbi:MULTISPECIES: Stp1/IreP family PP2C-type Ser/Thr phosphatase [unclassified Okeania]|uniref:Stp1/IreP family PP2C-type Ser/Thr phosphatase n=1 Tax=unclassified Okeania TaxID=2634635 RepID=UPI0013B8D2AC|nr:MULTISPECIES: Stp1/IreP family PP2C-type Ser/Thr phosphatase [unclassified Okeania]NES77868.1 Stp1/IreP family PP2C-type Ser/Thr phosphatase [Okeania sp. SIO1H4]NET15372.1 Stp1/IreP family PP2C-type Ser/Thr phosphatase [Okeania sp. SIO1H6]NET20084.1 Stp1/IreP family PP2C-type Ser/Thr phosphatase [Okeania sp. SIO1H5]NET92093.1 Stp1/IreP family PP2C-type Ser/Thr phosphatase [Okeania sp. SIO1H2]